MARTLRTLGTAPRRCEFGGRLPEALLNGRGGARSGCSAHPCALRSTGRRWLAPVQSSVRSLIAASAAARWTALVPLTAAALVS